MNTGCMRHMWRTGIRRCGAELPRWLKIKPDVCGGEPTIRGMRITVSDVLEMLAGGMTLEDILKDFPYLEKADIDAALE